MPNDNQAARIDVSNEKEVMRPTAKEEMELDVLARQHGMTREPVPELKDVPKPAERQVAHREFVSDPFTHGDVDDRIREASIRAFHQNIQRKAERMPQEEEIGVRTAGHDVVFFKSKEGEVRVDVSDMDDEDERQRWLTANMREIQRRLDRELDKQIREKEEKERKEEAAVAVSQGERAVRRGIREDKFREEDVER